jgi:outer membrane biosynthesis protein TonB
MTRWLILALTVLALSACAGGNCQRGGGNAAATTGGETQTVASQSPTEHAAPEHNLEFADLAVSATASDQPPDQQSRETVDHIVRGGIEDVHQCYENALATSPTVSGRVVVTFHVHATGNVVGADVAENTTGNDALGACITEHVDDWHFPEASHDTAVRYPFVLTPGAPAAPAAP